MAKTLAKSITNEPASKQSKEDKLHKIPLRITDTTLRDAHQSLWATRMRTDDILKIIDVIDNVGYYSLEVWGGATFDVCLRFLRENPWERLRLIKAKTKNTPLQMLLRGQNLVGYRNYADDVVDRFVALSCENGVDIFRIFDALNDTRNLQAAVKAVKKYGGHAQGTLSYTISPVHTVEKYVHYAREQVAIGIDSLCIKDMAGILTPIGAETLVGALVKEVGIPIQLHCHATSGMATATYVEGVRAGAGAIDCAISTMAGTSAQPPVESLAAIFNETHYAAHLDLDALEKVAKYFVALAPKRVQSSSGSTSIIDPGILVHQIPGGMISNFRSQLDKQGALDKLDDALREVSVVRKDLGFPPLVTPTSQIVGTQAAMNVLTGERYKVVPNEVKEYVRGMYGRSPVPIEPAFIKQILGDKKPITHRPADDIAPMLPKATDGLDPDLIDKDEDIISHVILPEPALQYFKWRKLPADQRPEIPADAELRQMKEAAASSAPKAPVTAPAAPKASSGVSAPQPMLHEDDYRGLSLILGKAAGLKIDELAVRKADFRLTVRGSGAGVSMVDSADDLPVLPPKIESSSAAPAKPEPTEVAVAEPSAADAPKEYGETIDAPLGGTFYASSGPGKGAFVKLGDTVKAGAKVCVVEAMKLFNEIVAKKDCTIVKILVADGESVTKGQPLIAVK